MIDDQAQAPPLHVLRHDPRRRRGVDLPRGFAGDRVHGRAAGEQRARARRAARPLRVGRATYHGTWRSTCSSSRCDLGAAIRRVSGTDALNIVVNSGSGGRPGRATLPRPHHSAPRRRRIRHSAAVRRVGDARPDHPRRLRRPHHRRAARSGHRGRDGPPRCDSGVRGVRPYEVKFGARRPEPRSWANVPGRRVAAARRCAWRGRP